MALRKLSTMWASPDDPEIRVRSKSAVTCAHCKAAYIVQAIGNEETRQLLPAVAVQHNALVNFKSIFPDHEWADLERSVTAAAQPVTAAAQPDADELHIFLALGGRRAYLVCGRTAGRFAAVAVEAAAAG